MSFLSWRGKAELRVEEIFEEIKMNDVNGVRIRLLKVKIDRITLGEAIESLGPIKKISFSPDEARVIFMNIAVCGWCVYEEIYIPTYKKRGFLKLKKYFIKMLHFKNGERWCVDLEIDSTRPLSNKRSCYIVTKS